MSSELPVTDAGSTSRILTLVFTDLADSTALKTQHGDQAAGDLIAHHRALVQRLAVVEGSVRRAGDRIRVTAQLIDARSDEHVWAKSYDRAVKDVFALQDEISATIAASLVDDLTRAEGERARQRGTDNLGAWGFYQLGLQHFDRYTPEDFSEARRLFERATELDPRFATAFGYAAVAGISELSPWARRSRHSIQPSAPST